MYCAEAGAVKRGKRIQLRLLGVWNCRFKGREEAKGGAPCARTEILLLRPYEAAGSLQRMEVHSGAGRCQKKSRDPVGSQSWSRLLSGLVCSWKEEPSMKQVFCQEWWSWEVTTLTSHAMDPTLKQAKSVRSILPEDEEAAEILCFSETTEDTEKQHKNLS